MFSKEFFGNLDLSTHAPQLRLPQELLSEGHQRCARMCWKQLLRVKTSWSLCWYFQEPNSLPRKWGWLSKTFVVFPEEVSWYPDPAQYLISGTPTLTNKLVFFLGMCYNPVPYGHFKWQAKVKSWICHVSYCPFYSCNIMVVRTGQCTKIFFIALTFCLVVHAKLQNCYF